MKPNQEADFWCYEKQNLHIAIVYCVDGQRMGKYSAVHYLKEKYGMDDASAYDYVNNKVKHI